MGIDGLRQSVAVVTGASSGIGRATALALAGEGASVVLAARSAEALAEVAARARAIGVEALVVPTDVADREQVRRLIRGALERFGRVDVLVANAGVMHRCPVKDLKVEDVERVMAVNFYGCLYAVLETLPGMLERRSGHIVIMSSAEAKKAVPPEAAYAVSKFAVAALGDALRQETRGTGVRVTTMYPSRIDTALIPNLDVPWISPKLPPERVGEAVVRAIRRRQAEVYVPYAGPKALAIASALSCGLADWGVRFFGLGGKERAGPGRT